MECDVIVEITDSRWASTSRLIVRRCVDCPGTGGETSQVGLSFPMAGGDSGTAPAGAGAVLSPVKVWRSDVPGHRAALLLPVAADQELHDDLGPVGPVAQIAGAAGAADREVRHAVHLW